MSSETMRAIFMVPLSVYCGPAGRGSLSRSGAVSKGRAGVVLPDTYANFFSLELSARSATRSRRFRRGRPFSFEPIEMLTDMQGFGWGVGQRDGATEGIARFSVLLQ